MQKKNSTKINIILPENLLNKLDEVAGPRNRSPFVVNLIRQELKRKEMLKILDKASGSWTDEDYPEFDTSAKIDKFVDELRKRD
ncbi:MAG: hypothetical protein K8T10_12420 [Candidatus Eremiobacteraeota bacterium]|nr:hypothetical protein [Candidatus Eremiobacteraeota bacterium]